LFSFVFDLTQAHPGAPGKGEGIAEPAYEHDGLDYHND